MRARSSLEAWNSIATTHSATNSDTFAPPDEAPDSLDLDQLLQRWVAKEAWVKRHHGSALPEQLAELKLLPAEAGTANVQLHSTAAFHLAITARAMPADCDLDLGGNAVLQMAYWRL